MLESSTGSGGMFILDVFVGLLLSLLDGWLAGWIRTRLFLLRVSC